MTVYHPFFRKERYPRGLAVDFRKLESRALLKYVEKHGIAVRPDSTQAELAVAVARHFEERDVNEAGVLCSFIKRCTAPGRPFQIPEPWDPSETSGDGSPNAQQEQYGRGLRSATAAANAAAAAAANGGGSGHQGPQERNGSRNDASGRHATNGALNGSGKKNKRMRAKADDEDEEGGQKLFRDDADAAGAGPILTRRGGERAAAATAAGGRDRDNNLADLQAMDEGVDGDGASPSQPSKKRLRADSVVSALTTCPKKGSVVEPGDIVAAKMPGNEDADRGNNYGWVLCRAVKFDEEQKEWTVDDEGQLKVAQEAMVRRLHPNGHGVAKGDTVLAIFPETTSFYLAEVVKVSKPNATAPSNASGTETGITLRFRDDVDDVTKETPLRYAHLYHVIPLPEGEEPQDDKPSKQQEQQLHEPSLDQGRETPQPPQQEQPMDFGEQKQAAAPEAPAATSGDTGATPAASEAPAPQPNPEERPERRAAVAAPPCDRPPQSAAQTKPPALPAPTATVTATLDEMVASALARQPQRHSVAQVCQYLEEHFHDHLDWRSDGSNRRTPVWRGSVKRLLAEDPRFQGASATTAAAGGNVVGAVAPQAPPQQPQDGQQERRQQEAVSATAS